MDKGHTINVLDKGYVRLIDFMGDDRRIVETARISYKSPSKGDEADKKLLHYLYKNRHTSPLESCSISFNIKMPIFVMRQFVRHRTFRLNEWSGRYSELADDFYFPESWRPQDTKNKQGSLETENWNPPAHIYDSNVLVTDDASGVLQYICDTSYEAYQILLKAGVAKEMARMVLPVNLYTEIYVNCDIHNLCHFLNLRLHPHAQWEIREYAKAMYIIFSGLFPWTAEAFERFKFQIVDLEQQD